jgi:DNA end-binding protein Ku
MPSTTTAKTLHRATIQCGPIAVPCRVLTLIDNKAGISFVQLHGKCGGRVKQPMYCPTCDENIAWSETVKGYEVSKDEVVQFSAEEIKALGVDGNSIEVIEFANVADIDPRYFAKPYVVAADKGGERAYGLIHESMRRSGNVALCRYRARGKEYLAALRPVEGGFLLHQLHYEAAVRDVEAVTEFETFEYSDAELDATSTFIDAYSRSSEEFNLADYRDEYTESVKARIEEKLAGGDLGVAPPVQKAAPAVDLAAAMLSAAEAKATAAAVGTAEAEKNGPAARNFKRGLQAHDASNAKKPAAKKPAKKAAKKAPAKKAASKKSAAKKVPAKKRASKKSK